MIEQMLLGVAVGIGLASAIYLALYLMARQTAGARPDCQRPCCRYDLTVGLRASDQASEPLSATAARLQGSSAYLPQHVARYEAMYAAKRAKQCRHLFIGVDDTAKCNVCGMLWAEWTREPR